MAKRIPVEISTTNKKLPKVPNNEGQEVHREISVTVQVEVPETLEEGAQFYGSEEKLLEAVQGDVARRKANAARPLIRDAESELDFQTVAQQAVDQYTPGRKPGFGAAPTISEETLASAQNMDELIAALRAAGINVVPQGAAAQPAENESEELVGVGGEDEQ